MIIRIIHQKVLYVKSIKMIIVSRKIWQPCSCQVPYLSILNGKMMIFLISIHLVQVIKFISVLCVNLWQLVGVNLYDEQYIKAIHMYNYFIIKYIFNLIFLKMCVLCMMLTQYFSVIKRHKIDDEQIKNIFIEKFQFIETNNLLH